MDNYSVLMTIYKKDTPIFVKAGIDSMFEQTYKTNDFVLVCDGELTAELNAVINDYENKYSEILMLFAYQKTLDLEQLFGMVFRFAKMRSLREWIMMILQNRKDVSVR